MHPDFGVGQDYEPVVLHLNCTDICYTVRVDRTNIHIYLQMCQVKLINWKAAEAVST